MTTRIPLAAALLAATLIPLPSMPAATAAPLAGGDGPGCCIAPAPRAIDLAICLDTSGSMSGLIDSAKEKLWAIVNELGRADPTPDLRVGLLTYGNDGHSPEDGWVRLDVPFTTDLDAVSAQLFSLTTNGGTEYVGRVVDYATSQLSWSTDSNALKIVVVAGNESADQDTSMLFRDVCAEAKAGGFHVNSIYCGNAEDEFAPAWRDVAVLASGYFATIDKDNGTLAVATPYDADLARLNTVLNATYIPFGVSGAAGARNQVAQDSNAVSLNAAALADRATTKAGKLYKCAWDLVDACESQEVNVEDMSVEALPAVMQAMTIPERKTYVAKKKTERAAVQEEIETLSTKRSQHIARVVAQDSLDDGRSFDKVLRDAVRSQALAIGFTFPVQEPVVVELRPDVDIKSESMGPPAPLDVRRVRAQSLAAALPMKDDC